MINITFIVSLAWTLFWESFETLLPVVEFGGVDFFDIAYTTLGLLLGGLPVVVTIWDHAFEREQEAARKAEWDARNGLPGSVFGGYLPGTKVTKVTKVTAQAEAFDAAAEALALEAEALELALIRQVWARESHLGWDCDGYLSGDHALRPRVPGNRQAKAKARTKAKAAARKAKGV